MNARVYVAGARVRARDAYNRRERERERQRGGHLIRVLVVGVLQGLIVEEGEEGLAVHLDVEALVVHHGKGAHAIAAVHTGNLPLASG